MNHGASEISWLSPEYIERIEIIKGPFSALYGNFAMGGVVNIVTKNYDPAPSVGAYGGSFGTFRALGIFSTDLWSPTPFLAQDYYTIEGYRDNAQLNQWSPFNKVSWPIWGGLLSLRYNYFQSRWGAPGYWPIDWVKSRLVKRTQAYNPTDGGRNKRYEVVMNYAPVCGERGLYATLYVADFHHKRFAKFLPVTGSQFGRQDDRYFWGGRAFYHMVFGDMASLTVGGETRQDNGETQQYYTEDRRRTTTRYDYEMKLSNWAMFIQGQIKPTESVKIVGGVRWDYFSQDFDNLVLPANSGKGSPYIRSPKIGFVFTPVANLNIFGNIGCGFRSPSYLEVSPYSANTATGFDLEPAMVQTYDIGCNATVFGNLYLAADYYHTNMQREIRTINGYPVNIGDTVREGYELEAKYYPSENIDFFGSYAWVDAKVTDPTTPGRLLVTDISEHTIKAGISMKRDFGLYGGVLADLYYEYFSGTPNYSGSTLIYGPDFDVYNFKLTYSGRGWSSFFSARCKPREYANDTTWVNTGLLVYDPPPKWDLVGGLSYTFW
jgi:outer membrane receptor protein involved in Fe transport